MKLEKTLLALLVMMWIVAIITTLMPEIEGARGTAHPDFVSMSHGGSGVDRHAQVLWMNWAFGMLTILIFAILLAFGSRKRESLRGLGRWLVITTIGCLGAWTWLVVSYQRYMTEDTHALVFALPAPSAVMLYVLLPISVLFNIFYVVGFKRWILSDEDLADYERLLAARKASQHPDKNQLPEDDS